MVELATRLRCRLRDLIAAEGGSISMEFAVIMPLLIFLSIGGLAFWDAFRSQSQTNKIAYTISDIVSRYEQVDDTDITYLYAVMDKMLSPDLDRRLLRISSICFNGAEHRVLWSVSAVGSDRVDPGPLADEEIPLTLLPEMAPQDSVILTELEARWQPKIVFGIGERMWRSALVVRPRFVKIVPHSRLNPANLCPASAPTSS